MIVLCENCKTKVDFDDYVSLEKHCPNCNEKVEFCNGCKKLFPIDGYDEDAELCFDCFYENYEPCHDCGEYYATGDLIGGLCEICYWESEEEDEEEED